MQLSISFGKKLFGYHKGGCNRVVGAVAKVGAGRGVEEHLALKEGNCMGNMGNIVVL